MIHGNDVTGIVLCGGKGSRLNGEDKPLLRLGSKRIIDHVCERLAPQVTSIVLSCSRNVAIYEGLHHQTCVDRDGDSGPLAGLTEAFGSISSQWVVTTPGDTPFLATDLVDRLSSAVEDRGVAVPIVNGFRQNLCLVLNRQRMRDLDDFYTRGGSAVKDWLDQTDVKPIDLSDIADSFFNINTAAELATARDRIGESEGNALS